MAISNRVGLSGKLEHRQRWLSIARTSYIQTQHQLSHRHIWRTHHAPSCTILRIVMARFLRSGYQLSSSVASGRSIKGGVIDLPYRGVSYAWMFDFLGENNFLVLSGWSGVWVGIYVYDRLVVDVRTASTFSEYIARCCRDQPHRDYSA